MNAFLYYLLAVSVNSLLFYAAYALLLRNETNFRFNRIYLLSALAFSLAIPLFDWSVLVVNFFQSDFKPIGNVFPTFMLPAVEVNGNIERSNPHLFILALQYVYLAGLVFFLFRMAAQLIKLWRHIQRSRPARVGSTQVFELSEPTSTFSFFRFIFIGHSKSLTDQERDSIVKHEQAHAHQFHSIDMILLSALQALLWFNPIIYLYKKTLVQLHEFEADSRAVENFGTDQYCSLLAKAALHSSGFSFANHFNNSLTLKRINMIKSEKRNLPAWKKFGLFTMVGATLLAVACGDAAMNGVSKIDSQAADQAVNVVEEVATPKGGMRNFYEFIGAKLNYPASARGRSIHGKVFVQFTVNKDGQLSDFEIIRGIGGGLDEEVVRVLKLAPAWNPARDKGIEVKSKLTLPIEFKLDGISSEEIENPPGALSEIIITAYPTIK
jgi:TonB family protein